MMFEYDYVFYISRKAGMKIKKAFLKFLKIKVLLYDNSLRKTTF